MIVLLVFQQELQEKVLLGLAESFSLFNLMTVCNLQLLQHLVTGVCADIVAIHGYLKYLIEQIVDVDDGRDLQVLHITEIIIESLNIRLYDLHNTLLPKIRHDKHLVHIDVVLESAVLNTSLELLP